MNFDQPNKTPCLGEDLYQEVDEAISDSATAEVIKVQRTSDNKNFAKKIVKFQDG